MFCLRTLHLYVRHVLLYFLSLLLLAHIIVHKLLILTQLALDLHLADLWSILGDWLEKLHLELLLHGLESLLLLDYGWM